MAIKENYALPKDNLILLAVGFVIILIGFVCMIGGGSVDGVSYNPEIFSPMRITVAPIIVVVGFFFEIFAILWIRKPGNGVTRYEENDGFKENNHSDGYKSIKASDNYKRLD